MEVRNKNFYDILSFGLMDYENYQEYVNSMFATKYNTPNTEGFPWDDLIQTGFDYAQIEAEIGGYTMATVVSPDGKGGVKSFEEVKMSTGKIPRMKHEFAIDEGTLREMAIVAAESGNVSPRMQSAINSALFNSTDQLLGGNHMSLKYQRNQVVSTGKYIVTPENNPDGIASLTFNFNVPDANRGVCGGFGNYGVAAAWSDDSADPIGDLRDMVEFAEDNLLDFGHFEMSQKKFRQFLAHPNVRKQVMTTMNSNADLANLSTVLITDASILNVLEGIGLPPIKVHDTKEATVMVDKFNTTTRRVEKTKIASFDEDVVVLVPDGQLGTIKAVAPMYLPDPAVRSALFDGGRTEITQLFDTETKTQRIKSELTALVVPNQVRNHIILDTTQA